MAAALERAGLAARRDDLVSGFSRGMRQRLALERALLHDPRLLLLDEPFTGLDDASVAALVARLQELRAAERIVVVVTHDLDVAERLLDTVAVLKDGRLAAFDEAHGPDPRALPGPRGGGGPMFLRVAWLVMRKDLTVEVRSREILYTTVFFAVACVLVFAFALVKEGRPLEDAAAGIMWISMAFSGTLALGRTFERERHSETLRALMLAPASRPAIYVGKLLGIVLLLLIVEAVLVPLVGLLFHAPIGSRPAHARRAAPRRDGRLLGGRHAVRGHAGARAQPRRDAADPAVSDHDPGDHRRRSRHGGAVRGGAGRRPGADVAGAAGVL